MLFEGVRCNSLIYTFFLLIMDWWHEWKSKFGKYVTCDHSNAILAAVSCGSSLSCSKVAACPEVSCEAPCNPIPV